MNLNQLLLGSMLGDGSITKRGMGRHCRFSIAHSAKQKDYIQYKHEIFKSYGLANKLSFYTIKNARYKNEKFHEYRFKTKGAPIFSRYRELFYPEGKKVIPDIISNLDERGLAIWFMDDGYRTGRQLKGAVFSTCGFTKSENEKLCSILSNKFNLTCSIHKTNEIYIWVRSVPTLLDLITPFIVPSMKYKVLHKSGELQERLEC